MNDHLVLVAGKSGTGKSTSLRNLRNPETVMYLNCDAGKRLPFKVKFGWDKTVTDPLQILDAFDRAEAMPECKVIIIDTFTFLMERYESLYVKTAADTRAAWQHYGEFIRTLMQDKVAKSTKMVIFLAHTLDKYNESEMIVETSVPVKGAAKNQGFEAYFTNVLGTKKIKITDLPETCASGFLNITDKEKLVGFKYVFQTGITKDTVNERLRGPMMMWEDDETFIDNDIQLVIDRFQQYYA